MTQASKLKAVIRARAVKTGESYTAARRQVLAVRPRLVTPKPRPEPAPRVKTTEAAPAPRTRRVPAGELSDRTARKSTGHGLEHWFAVLDEFGKKHGHTLAADHLNSEHKIQAWHAQMITVTWERARGLRQANQSCTGTFQVSVSRALAAPIEWVVGFFNDGKSRKRWLATATPALRTALEEAFINGKSMVQTKPDYARMRYKWLSSVVEIRVYGKPGAKSSLVADTSDLPDADAVNVRREAFSQALDQLRDIAAASNAAA